MKHELRVGITADVLPGPLRNEAAGSLTGDTYPDLIRVIHRGATLRGCAELTVDLGGLKHVLASALDDLNRYVAHHQAVFDTPVITVENVPQPHGEGPVRGRSRSTFPVVSELMSPISATIGMDDTLQDAATKVTEGRETLVVVSLQGAPIGFVSARDVRTAAWQDPHRWWAKRCASLVQICENSLHPAHTVEMAIQRYRDEGVKPLLVFDGDAAVGLLDPHAVRRWCRDHGPALLDERIRPEPRESSETRQGAVV